LHRDSLGSEQVIRAGQLNLMTAGDGVSHSEERVPGFAGELHGMQLWVAQPERTRHGAAAFEHHDALPEFEIGDATGTVIVGELAGVSSPARRDTDHVGADVVLRRGRAVLPVQREHEYAAVVLDGEVRLDGTPLRTGELGYCGMGRDELVVEAAADARLLLLGGEPFEERIVMWWNFVGRDNDELAAADAAWRAGDRRFGTVASPLTRVDAPVPPWLRGDARPDRSG
jgi:redox-sensitive bicupin YhaK (pirin superfamily)